MVRNDGVPRVQKLTYCVQLCLFQVYARNKNGIIQ